MIVFVSGRGEIRNSVSIGPSSADNKGRVRITIDTESGALSRDRAHLVGARELAVPESARREYAAAMKRLSERDVAGAITHLQRATEISPDFAAAWNHLGTIAYQTKRFEDAERYFRRSLYADPELYEPLVNLGGVLVTTGQLEEGRKVNDEAIARSPQDALAQSQLGMNYLFLGKLELAEKHLLRATELDSKHFSHPQLHLAEVYTAAERLKSAAAQLESFLRNHPDHPDAAWIRELLKNWR